MMTCIALVLLPSIAAYRGHLRVFHDAHPPYFHIKTSEQWAGFRVRNRTDEINLTQEETSDRLNDLF